MQAQENDVPKITTQKKTITFAIRLRNLLHEREISQSELSRITGIDRTEINRTVNGRRQVQPHEIPWIAKALELGVDELLEGVELPEPVRRARQELEALAKRVLEAEGARDAAREQFHALEQVMSDERRDHARRMRELEGVLQGVQAEFAAFRKDSEARERQLRAEQQGTEQQVAVLTQSVSAVLAERHALQRQLATTRTELTSAQSAKVATGVLAGLAGILIGAVRGGGDDDDDLGDDDED